MPGHADRSHLFFRISFLVLALLNAWVWMQAVHEFGHIAAAWLTGGHVVCVVWHIANISRTDVMPNPSPLAVCWAGPVLGSLIPAGIKLASQCCLSKPRDSKVASASQCETARAAQQVAPTLPGQLQFFAGFCLVANGAYIAVGSIDGVGDAGDLLRLGSPNWLLWLVGSSGIAAGFYMWHRLGGLSDVVKLRPCLVSVFWQLGWLLLALGLQFSIFAGA